MRAPRIRRPSGGPEADAGRRGRGRSRRRGGRPLTPVPVYSAHLPATALGTLRLWATDRGLRRLAFRSGPDLALPGERLGTDTPPAHLEGALDAVRAYLAGRGKSFDIPLDLGDITPFRRRVYDRLKTVPYGQVVTYGEVARDVAEGAGAARAVGQAVGSNPVAIIIPCHRVVAADGSLHGYAGGLDRKATLLGLEGIEVRGSTATSKVHPEILRLPL